MRHKKKYLGFIQNIGLILIGIFVLAVVLEIGLRFLPVNERLAALPVNDANPVLRFKPDRESIWSFGPDFSIVNTVRTNNYGFVNDRDYDPSSTLPLIAVIGDSYIEAAMVPFPETGHGFLADALKGKARVYSFASSGTALSGYLGYAAYARDNFHPDKLVVLIVGNDFDESLCRYKNAPGFYCFDQSPDGSWNLQRKDYQPSLARTMIRHSRLALYLAVNCRLYDTLKKLKNKLAGKETPIYIGNTAAEVSPERLRDSRKAVDLFLDQLPEAAGLRPSDILLCLDGIRQALYEPGGLEAVKGSYYGLMRRYLLDEAPAYGYQILDLQPIFKNEFAKSKKHFEFLQDGHWNALGHRIFFQALFDSGFVDEFKL